MFKKILALITGRSATAPTVEAPYKVETPVAESAPYKVPEPAATTPIPLVVEVAPAPAKKPAAKKPAAKKPAAKKPVAKKSVE